MGMAADACVAVFARAPVRGAVKTRLAAAIGHDAALQTHRELLRWTLDQIKGSDDYDVELWVAGDPGAVAGDVDGVSVHRQADGDLGQRMLAAIESITERGQRAVVIGCDCPVMSRDYLERACAALDTADVVVGPSEDGGYALIGMHRGIADLFTGMTWSVASVCRETCRRADELALVVSLLPTVWDVDTVADWRRWRASV
jgi:rSAM/selenodomain-associated transferase 1